MAEIWLPGKHPLARAARGWPISPDVKPTIPIKLNTSNSIGRKVKYCWLLDRKGNVYDLGPERANATILQGTARADHWDLTAVGDSAIAPVTAISGDQAVFNIVCVDNTDVDSYVTDGPLNNEFAILTGYQNGYWNTYSKAGTNPGTYPLPGGPSSSQMPVTGNDLYDNVLYSVSGTTLTGFLNGKKLVSGTLVANTNYTISTGNMTFQRTAGGVIKLKLTVIFSEGLTDAEGIELTKDPYRWLLEPANQTPFKVGVSGAEPSPAPILSNITATGITTNSVTPQIDVDFP